MLTVEDYRRIRVAHSDGMSIRAIARKFHHSRRKIRQVLKNPEPCPYTRQKEPPAPQLGAFKPIVLQILADDEQAPRKQRHTAAKIYTHTPELVAPSQDELDALLDGWGFVENEL